VGVALFAFGLVRRTGEDGKSGKRLEDQERRGFHAVLFIVIAG